MFGWRADGRLVPYGQNPLLNYDSCLTTTTIPNSQKTQSYVSQVCTPVSLLELWTFPTMTTTRAIRAVLATFTNICYN